MRVAVFLLHGGVLGAGALPRCAALASFVHRPPPHWRRLRDTTRRAFVGQGLRMSSSDNRRRHGDVDGSSSSNAHSASEKRSTESKNTATSAATTRTKAVLASRGDDHNSAAPIRGLMPHKCFAVACRSHCTITLLRKWLPTLLDASAALSSGTASQMYGSDVTVVGPGGGEDRLAMGADEVVLLSRALAAAATAARRAGSFFDAAVGAGSPPPARGAGALECQLLLDPDAPLRLIVLWRTRLPAPGAPFGNHDDAENTSTEFTGRSTFHLCNTTGLVANVQINAVKINGVAIETSLGTALAAVRRAARLAATSSALFDDAKEGRSGNALLAGLLNGLQGVAEAVEALPSNSAGNEGGSTEVAPLYVELPPFWDDEGCAVNATTLESTDSSKNVSAYVPIDEYPRGGGVPLAGAFGFVDYATTHRALQRFSEDGLRRLAGASVPAEADGGAPARVTTETVRALFATDAELATSRGLGREPATLLRGAGPIADLYRSLALFREASGGEWQVENLEADLESRCLSVRWRTESPLQIEGTDVFLFDEPSAAASSRSLPWHGDGDTDEVAARCASFFDDGANVPPHLSIRQIVNQQLTVAGVATDAAWAQSFVSATKNAPLIPDATVTELLRALTSKKKTPLLKNHDKPNDVSQDSMPVLDEAAAAAFYGILRALHGDFLAIASAGAASAPAGEFLADTVELRGLLGEVLARGHSKYHRTLGVAVALLRAAIQTGAVRVAAEPRSTIEVTSKGTIKTNFILALWVNPNPLGGSDSQGFGVPLKIEVSSEYIVDNTGQVREHRILESRLNGVLTPGDVFSRWVRGLAGEEGGEANKVRPPSLESLKEALAWVRSMQERK